MAHNVFHQAPVRTAVADLVVGKTSTADWNSGTNQVLKLYTGTVPANADAALSGNTAAATITAITWGTASGGVASVTASTADSSAVGGTVTFFRLYRTAAVDVADIIFQGTVGTSGTDLTLNNTVVNPGASVSLSSGSYTSSV